ncbi:hypothetical protein K7432_008353 [Basidiobolus ranarum]|uniref:Rhomboid-type serine protease n=1 Tax=Basidiobolus ranarum TaxID=34480 RepID=A0ABR2VZ81_9FUNG
MGSHNRYRHGRDCYSEDADLILPVEENSGRFSYRKNRPVEQYTRQIRTYDYQIEKTAPSQVIKIPPPQPGFLGSIPTGQNDYPPSTPYEHYLNTSPSPPLPVQEMYTIPQLDSKQDMVQEQSFKRKHWRPWFIRTVSLAQLVLVIYSLYRNSQLTGSWIQTSPYFNWLIGPAPETLINIGARYVPCMRSTGILGQPIMCNSMDTCNLEKLCGFGGFKGGDPNQWFRFIVPVFLHGGVIHYLANMTFQLTSGAQMEREMGPFRMALLYMSSGIGGLIFGGNFAPQRLPSVGASGALFGLIGCQLVNLIQHWKSFRSPCCELIKIILVVLINFAIGLLPNIDNFAHIGGFICGIFIALLVLPTAHTSSWGKWVKRFLMVLGLGVVVALYCVGLKFFYSGENPNKYCPWCKYLSCLPIQGWCDTLY